jgi:hypothetical protein
MSFRRTLRARATTVKSVEPANASWAGPSISARSHPCAHKLHRLVQYGRRESVDAALQRGAAVCRIASELASSMLRW